VLIQSRSRSSTRPPKESTLRLFPGGSSCRADELLEEADWSQTPTQRIRPAEPRRTVAGIRDSAPLLLQGHVDVVTTAGQNWQRPPFGGDLVDGEVWVEARST